MPARRNVTGRGGKRGRKQASDASGEEGGQTRGVHPRQQRRRGKGKLPQNVEGSSEDVGRQRLQPRRGKDVLPTSFDGEEDELEDDDPMGGDGQAAQTSLRMPSKRAHANVNDGDADHDETLAPPSSQRRRASGVSVRLFRTSPSDDEEDVERALTDGQLATWSAAHPDPPQNVKELDRQQGQSFAQPVNGDDGSVPAERGLTVDEEATKALKAAKGIKNAFVYLTTRDYTLGPAPAPDYSSTTLPDKEAEYPCSACVRLHTVVGLKRACTRYNSANSLKCIVCVDTGMPCNMDGREPVRFGDVDDVAQRLYRKRADEARTHDTWPPEARLVRKRAMLSREFRQYGDEWVQLAERYCGRGRELVRKQSPPGPNPLRLGASPAASDGIRHPADASVSARTRTPVSIDEATSQVIDLGLEWHKAQRTMRECEEKRARIESDFPKVGQNLPKFEDMAFSEDEQDGQEEESRFVDLLSPSVRRKVENVQGHVRRDSLTP